MVELVKNRIFIEYDIRVNEELIGRVGVNDMTHEIIGLEIFDQYQNRGYGTEVVKKLIEKHGCDCLTVKDGNDIAIHVYEKLGFKITQPLYHFMERR